ncbi:MAG: GNAT family N-acetyltransferase [Methylobacterium sp.]|jgi:RimJ/RimL family protein N-acetyltransferase|nr:GNAT family N-acetyltransferase [Methylobacterium sp.]MCA3626368.1 GNAT family N-acetyltransferase [Methylobacterium sp.]
MLAEIPTIESERLVLGPWSEAHFDAYAAFWRDEETARFVGGACARDDAWRRMATIVGHWSLRGYGFWALTEKSSGAFVGWCGPWMPEGWPEREIGWGLLPAAQGKGYATEAAIRSRSYAYDVLGWKTTISLIDMQNFPSQRVAERLGARFEGTHLLRGSEAGIFRHPSPQDLQNLN